MGTTLLIVIVLAYYLFNKDDHKSRFKYKPVAGNSDWYPETGAPECNEGIKNTHRYVGDHLDKVKVVSVSNHRG